MSGEEKTGAGLAYALAHALTLCEEAAPLPVRMGWASFLRRYEPDPQTLTKAATEAHLKGLMHAGQLTPEGVRLALLTLSADLTPPYSQDPTWGRR